jgi:hypothetical protein
MTMFKPLSTKHLQHRNANVIGDVDVLGPIQDLHREVPGSV